MEGIKIEFLSKNCTYGIVKKRNTFQNIDHNIIYSDGQSLNYGDPAEIFGAITNADLIHFLRSSAIEVHYTKEHFGFAFGYQPADFDNDMIKENEVRIYYSDFENTIEKKEFYKLCHLLCDGKLNDLNIFEDVARMQEELLYFKSKFEEKIKGL